MMKKKALSEVVSTVLIIAVTILIGAVVWAVVSNLIGDKLDEGEKCFGVLDQVKINRDYTCYNPTTNKMQFSLSVGDLDINGILVSVSFEGTSKGATLTDVPGTVEDVTNYVETGTGSCTGTATLCAGLSQTDCGVSVDVPQLGCFWNPGGSFCIGTAISCSSISSQSSCENQLECAWGYNVKIPGKNAGSTYFFNGITSLPTSISIIPIIEGKQCGSADTLREIVDCNALVS